MYRASDRIAERDALDRLDAIGAALGIEEDTIAVAAELYLMRVPVEDRSRDAVLAACCYTACLLRDEGRTQTEIADAFDVTRHVIQRRWKRLIEEVGLDPPSW